MGRWVYWVSLTAIALVLGIPAFTLLTDPQADIRDLFRLGIDLEGGTSLIYELHAPEGGGEAPDAKAAKQVILQRIDPQGTRGYIVRAVGQHRLEIVLPGRQTKVRITHEAATQELLSAAQQAAQQNKAVADLIGQRFQAFAGGTRLVVRMVPPLYLDDIQTRIGEAVRERMPGQTGDIAVAGLTPKDDQWQEVAVFLTVRPDDARRLAEWENLITLSLSAQRDVTRVKRLVRQAGFLEFRIVAERVRDRDKANFDQIVRDRQAGKPPYSTQWRWYPLKKGWEWYQQGLLDEWNFIYVVDRERQEVEVLVNVADGQDVTGRDMEHAVASVSQGEPVVAFNMKATAGSRFAALTSPENRDRHMAIILDGVVQTAPVLRATLSTGGIIEGYKTRRELEEVVTILNSGQLAASLGDPVTERTVGPELGEDNIHKGLVASLVGFALVVLFMLAYYLFAGCVANVALLLNLALTISIMFWIKQTWTLPGIAGLILSLAMAVDANVLIFERLREEKGKEGSLGFALKKAYMRAFTTIFDSNLTTMIPAFVLLWPGLATEEVKGFAVVMIIGIGVSMFTAVVITRMIFETGIRWGWIKELRMLHLFQKPNLDWMRFARVAFVVTLAAAVAGVIVFLSRGQDKYDIEFVGGTQVELALKVPEGQDTIPIATVRQRANEALGGVATVQELEYAAETGETHLNRFLISVPAVGAAVTGEAAVKAKLAEAFADLRPEGGGTKVQVAVSEISEDVIRRRLESVQPAKAPAGGAPAAAPVEEARSVRYIPPEERQYLAKVRIGAQVTPPMGLGEFQRRIDTLIRDRFPEMVGTLYRVEGAAPGDVPGEFKSFELWVRDDFGGKHADTPNPAFWTGVVELAMGQQEAFASTTSFEPTMAGEAWDKAVIAILLSLTAMAVYIWLRFAKLSSGIAAVVATVHDVLITLGAVSVGAILSVTVLGTVLDLTDMKVNLPLIGAFLTLVGYSVNDTIVIFDRIRENRGKYGDLSIAIINNSINQTLSRTLLTGTTVLMAVLSLYFFGGKTSSIHGLAFVMLVGTVVGCYSSIAIASPILAMGDYLRKLYVWVYPVVGVGLLGYFFLAWPFPAEALGSWADGVRIALAFAGVVWVAWLALAWQAVHSYARGRPWAILVKSPPAASAIAAVSLAAPVLTVFLFAVMVLGARASGVAAWAGPAALAMLATCPATYFICKMARKTEEAR